MKPKLTKTLVLLTVILMDILAGMEFDLFVPSFPELQAQFHLSPFWVETFLSVNFIGFCFSLICVGSLADRCGRKPIIISGLLVFIIGTMICLWGQGYGDLILGRLLQGIGIAAPSILSFLIIADLYPLKKQQYYMAMLNGLMNTAIGLAPVMGSTISLYFHWQGNFIALLLLGWLTLISALFFIPAHKTPKNKKKLVLPGYLPLFQSKSLLLLLVFLVLYNVPYWVFVGMSPILFIKDLHVPLSQFGYYQGSLALIFALGSIGVGFIINRFDQKKMLFISGAIFMLSFISMAYITAENCQNPLLITLAILPFIIGQIVPATILYPICINLIPEAKARVSAVLQGSRLILCALGVQIASFYYAGNIQSTGLVITSFIAAAIVMFFWVMKNQELMRRALL